MKHCLLGSARLGRRGVVHSQTDWLRSNTGSRLIFIAALANRYSSVICLSWVNNLSCHFECMAVYIVDYVASGLCWWGQSRLKYLLSASVLTGICRQRVVGCSVVPALVSVLGAQWASGATCYDVPCLTWSCQVHRQFNVFRLPRHNIVFLLSCSY